MLFVYLLALNIITFLSVLSKINVCKMPPGKKKERKSLNLDLKLKVIRKMENGGKATEVGRQFGLSESTVRTIVKNREKIRLSSECATPTSATKVTRSRPVTLEKMEKLLAVWIEDLN